MGRLILELDEVVQQRWSALAKRAGHESVEVFLAEKLSSEVSEDFEQNAELEALLLERINDPRPSIAYTPDLIRDIARKVLGEVDAKGT